MALQFRKVTEAERNESSFIPAQGEPVYTYDSNKLYIGDGVTPGGVSVMGTVSLQEFLDVSIDGNSLQKGAFIYYDHVADAWKIGKPGIDLEDLTDVTTAEQNAVNFMIVYDDSTDRWVVQARAEKYLSDVPIFNNSDITTESLLEYSDTSEKFDAVAVPSEPNLGDLIGVNITSPIKNGHVLFYDESTNGLYNDYLGMGTTEEYHVNLNNTPDLAFLEYDAAEGEFTARRAFLAQDVSLISLSGLNEPQPPDEVYTLSYDNEDGTVVFNETANPSLNVYTDRVTVLDLSDPSFTGIDIRVSENIDGTNQLDPVGTEFTPDWITISGTPGQDGRIEIDYLSAPEEAIPWTFYYYQEGVPEAGGNLLVDDPVKKDFVLTWDSSNSVFDVLRFDYGLEDMADVQFDVGDDGPVNDQMLSWTAGLNKWTTPLDRVAGVGIGASLPRSYTKYTYAMWAGGVEGLGTFEIDLERGEELRGLKINIDEEDLEVDENGNPVEEEVDAYFFEDEETREEFLAAVEEAEAILKAAEGPDARLAREDVDAIADNFGAKKARLTSNEKAYTRTGKAAGAGQDSEFDPNSLLGNGMGGGASLEGLGYGMGGAGAGMLAGLSGGSGSGENQGTVGFGQGEQEPGLDELLGLVPSPEERAEEEAKKAAQGLKDNANKVFGALMARNRALKDIYPQGYRPDAGLPGAGGEGGGGLEMEVDTTNHTKEDQERVPPLMFGWRQSTDSYGYYYFTYVQRSAVLLYNTRDHWIDVQSRMRRCACYNSADSTFKVLFYYDADDSRYIAGEWLRIVEYQATTSQYTGGLQEFPSTAIREGLEEWDNGVTYKKGARVIHNDKVWELLTEDSINSEPASGTVLASSFTITSPESFLSVFVEIPAFSVKSQLFEGVYQQRITLGHDTGGGKTHPAFSFGEEHDDCDYLYVGANILTSIGSQVYDSAIIDGGTQTVIVDSKTGHRSGLQQNFRDVGCFLYDYNVHSALQHLMVSEFQSLNIERRLGECNLSPGLFQYYGEKAWSLDRGNSSGSTYNEGNGTPDGIPCYRGIHRPYGNMGIWIDGVNVDNANNRMFVNVDSGTHNDSSAQPATYKPLEYIPKPTLDSSGNGAGYLSNFWTWKSTTFQDFAYFTPKSIGGSREVFLGDRIKYLGATQSVDTLVVSTGGDYVTSLSRMDGEQGPFSLTLKPLQGSYSSSGARYCVKRRGAALTPNRTQTGNTELGNITDAEGNLVSKDVEQPGTLEPGQTWTKTKDAPIYSIVPGNDRDSGTAGTSTISLARKAGGLSATCIAVIDESTGMLRVNEFKEKWHNFRQQHPGRPFYLLHPAEGSSSLTNSDISNETLVPYRYDAASTGFTDLNAFFGFQVIDFAPLSKNLTRSTPQTYPMTLFTGTTNPGYTWGTYMQNMGSYVFDPGLMGNQSSVANDPYVRNIYDKQFTIEYKIKIPFLLGHGAQPTLTDIDGTTATVNFLFQADPGLTVEIYNPIKDLTTTVGTNTYNPSSPNNYTEVSYTFSQANNLFSIVDCHNQGEFLTLRVHYENTSAGNGTDNFYNNPGGWWVNGDLAKSGSSVNFFNSKSYADRFVAGAGAFVYSPYWPYVQLGVPENFAYERHFGYPTFGPMHVTRDNGNTSAITDWFHLCGLESAPAGSVVGLFIDRSGSMTQATVQASYSYFYQRCAAAGIIVNEVQNTVEDWITPFVNEI